MRDDYKQMALENLMAALPKSFYSLVQDWYSLPIKPDWYTVDIAEDSGDAWIVVISVNLESFVMTLGTAINKISYTGTLIGQSLAQIN